MLPPVSIVWPCSLSVDEYVSAGRTLEFPRPDCPSCLMKLTFWSGYRRQIRQDGRCRSMWVPRVRCDRCRATHALLPAFVLVGRLDVVETVGAVLEAVVEGRGGVRPAAANVQVPHTTAREWLRRFGSRASELAVAFAALAAELGGDDHADRRRRALRARCSSWRLAGRLGLPGMARCWPVALRLGRHRREVDRHQHELALPHRRQTAFHASCPLKGLNR